MLNIHGRFHDSIPYTLGAMCDKIFKRPIFTFFKGHNYDHTGMNCKTPGVQQLIMANINGRFRDLISFHGPTGTIREWGAGRGQGRGSHKDVLM